MSTYYGSSVANSTITTACTMSSTTGGTETSKTSSYSGGNHYGEVCSQGVTSGTTVTAIPSTPTGKGWVTAAPGAGSFATGNWSASIALALTSSATVNFTVRFFKYSSGSYTSIGSIATTAASLGTTRTVISFTATSMSSMTFGASDLLYVDLWGQDTTGIGGDNPIVYESNSSSTGVANDVQITTSTFTPSGPTTSTRTVPATIALLQTKTRTVLTSTPLLSTKTRTITASTTLAGMRTRTIPSTIAIGTYRLIPSTTALLATKMRTLSSSIALRGTITRPIPSTIALWRTSIRTIPTSTPLTYEILIGGFGVFASGPNTVSFDHLRFTQYPDPALSLAPVLPQLATSLVQWDAVTPTNTTLGIDISTDGVNWTSVSAGQAMTFDGSTGYISLPTTGLPTGASPWSLEVWCELPSLPASGYHAMLGFGTYATHKMAELSVQSTGTTAQFVCTTYSGDIGGPFTVQPGITYHVVGTYDGTSTRLYVNGALVAGPSALTLNIALAFASIGAGNSPQQDFFPGTIDEPLIYATALSSTQILANYNAGIATPASSTYTATVLGNAPIRYYHLDDTNTTAIDGGSQTQNGTLHGTITQRVAGLIASRNGLQLPQFSMQPDPTIDYFNTNSLTNYTNTAKSGGSAASVTYDTTNSRIILSGGSGGLYLNSTLSNGDVDLIADMDESDAGGLVWRYVDTGDYYELGAYDDSSSSGFTNQLRLYKVVSGTRSLIGSASAISWPRSTLGTSPYKRLRVTMIGTTITVYFDGTVMQTATDTTFASGQMGLRNDGGTSRYYQIRLQPVGNYVSGNPAGDIVTGQFVYTRETLSTNNPAVNPQIQDLTTSVSSPSIANGAIIPQLHDPSKPFATFYSDEMDTLTQASGDYYWAVNNSAVTFSERYGVPSPWCLHSSDLLFTPNVKPTFSADLYRNRQTITNCTGTVTVTGELKIADGTATSWQMAYPLYSAPTIVVEGIAKTVGVQGVDTGKDFYWQAASASISQDSSAVTIPSGYILSVSYVGQFPTIVTRNNLPEQAARQAVEGGTGIVEAIEDGKLMLASAATTYADGLLARFSNNNTVEVMATTRRTGLQKGQVLPAFMPEHNINNAQLLITKIITIGEQLADGTVLYQFQLTATNGPSLTRWATALGL